MNEARQIRISLIMTWLIIVGSVAIVASAHAGWFSELRKRFCTGEWVDDRCVGTLRATGQRTDPDTTTTKP